MRFILIFLSSLLFISTAQATTSYSCSKNTGSFKFETPQLQLTATKTAPQRYYLLTNRSTQPFLMDIAVHTGMSAGWSSEISPKHQSILAMAKPVFTLSCSYLDKNDQSHSLDCQKVLSVCQLNTPLKVNHQAVQTGNYWVKENF